MHKEVATKEMMDTFRELAKVSIQKYHLHVIITNSVNRIQVWRYDPGVHVSMLDINY